jgi:hypothetical protein
MNDLGDRFLDKGETVYAAKVDSVAAHTKLRSIEIEVHIKNDRVDTVKVYWNDYKKFANIYAGNRAGVFKTVIELDENSYLFQVVSVDSYGNSSLPVELSGDVVGDNYMSSIYNRNILDVSYYNKDLIVNWSSAPNTSIYTELQYTDTLGQKRTLKVSNDETVTTLSDWASDLQYRTAFRPNETAIDIFYVNDGAWVTIR